MWLLLVAVVVGVEDEHSAFVEIGEDDASLDDAVRIVSFPSLVLVSSSVVFEVLLLICCILFFRADGRSGSCVFRSNDIFWLLFF